MNTRGPERTAPCHNEPITSVSDHGVCSLNASRPIPYGACQLWLRFLDDYPPRNFRAVRKTQSNNAADRVLCLKNASLVFARDVSPFFICIEPCESSQRSVIVVCGLCSIPHLLSQPYRLFRPSCLSLSASPGLPSLQSFPANLVAMG